MFYALVSEWLKGNALKEFEEEYFSEEKLNKAIEIFHEDDIDTESSNSADSEEAEDKAPQDTMVTCNAII